VLISGKEKFTQRCKIKKTILSPLMHKKLTLIFYSRVINPGRFINIGGIKSMRKKLLKNFKKKMLMNEVENVG
jgi:hypothetical protein